MKKLITLLFSLLLSFNFSFGQEIEWQNTIGGDGADRINSLQQTSDGGYILGGNSSSNISGDKTENSEGMNDYWVVKLDANGNIQWQNTIGGSDQDWLTSIQQTSDGGYILGGWSSSNISGDKTEPLWGTYPTTDYWIVKIDALGNIQWQNTIGGTDYDYLYSIHQTLDGGYILAGSSCSDISGDKTENSLGNDYWIVKADASGNIQWQNTIGGSNDDLLNSIQQTSDGGFILGGWSWSNISGDKTENSNGDEDYWVIKTDSIGNIQWQNTIGGNDIDWLESIQQTADGGYILGGSSTSDISGDKAENHINGFDFWIVKTDIMGNIQWQNTIGANSVDEIRSTKQTADGGYIICGYSQSNISGDKTENNCGSYDYWLIKTDSLGNIQWQNTIGGSSTDEPHLALQTLDGGYIIGGYSWSNISGDKFENAVYPDFWVIKLTDIYNTMAGKLFIDVNNSGAQDIGEPNVIQKMVTEINTSRFNFSQPDGSFKLVVLDSGNFSVYPAPINYYNPVPATQAAYFSNFQQTDSSNDFAFQPIGVFNDLCITITPLGNFRAGFNASYMINYENVGTTTLNPAVIFFPDNDVTFVSANPVASFVTTDSVVWNFGPLAPFQTGSILVTVNVNVGTPIGTLINSGVRIEPVAGDANTACNYSYWEVLATGAVDPNAILVDRDTILTTELSNPPYLDYIIYFQNTGNDTAFNARVLNNLPQELDVNSFEFVASSHPMNITYGAHARLMTFTFDNILLPDSIVNEPESHGFVRYRIKPNTTLAAGDSIRNTAFIYFDFNQPVQTNTVVTEIVLPTGSPTLTLPGGEGIILAPNPAINELVISLKPPLRGGLVGLKVYDLFGRKVFFKQYQTISNNVQASLDISALAKGIYFVQLKTSQNIYSAKFVKQ